MRSAPPATKKDKTGGPRVLRGKTAKLKKKKDKNSLLAGVWHEATLTHLWLMRVCVSTILWKSNFQRLKSVKILHAL